MILICTICDGTGKYRGSWNLTEQPCNQCCPEEFATFVKRLKRETP